jgi:hypothetical protein
MLALRVDIEQAHFPGGKSGSQQFTAGAFCVSLFAVTTDNKRFHFHSPCMTDHLAGKPQLSSKHRANHLQPQPQRTSSLPSRVIDGVGGVAVFDEHAVHLARKGGPRITALSSSL